MVYIAVLTPNGSRGLDFVVVESTVFAPERHDDNFFKKWNAGKKQTSDTLC